MQYFDLNDMPYSVVLKNLFKSLNKGKIKYILDNSSIKKYQKNEIILNKNNCADALYILMDGIIQIGYLSAAGRFHAFNYFSQKNFINLLPCLKQLHIDYDYYAFNQVKVLVIPNKILEEIVRENSALDSDFLDVIALRMHQLISEVKFLHVANLHQKLCKILLDLSRQYGIRHPLGTEIKIKLSQHDLADLLSASRQTVNKEIKVLVSSRVIHCQYESIIIMDQDYLKDKINLI